MKIPIVLADKAILFKQLKKASPSIDPSEVNWFWNTNMSLNNGNLGAYYGILNELHLPHDSRLIALTQVEMLPTICHELFHAFQRKTMGLVFYKICAIPLVVNITIEPGARKEARRVEIMLGLQGQNTGEQPGD
jgi:hypothetical protein